MASVSAHMAQVQRTSSYALCFLAAFASTLLDSTPAVSRAPTGWELLGSCSARVTELEAEVATLRHELAVQSAHADPSGSASRENEPDAKRSRSTDGSQLPDCAVAFEISDGIKRFKEQCVFALRSPDPCDVPYERDAAGVKRFKADCLRSE